MQHLAASVALLVAVVSCVLCADICDVCTCNSNKFDTHSVTCDCQNTEMKDIITTTQNMKELHHIQTFSVLNCESVKFEKNSFGNARDLSSVTVSNVSNVVFPLGVFSSLSILKIENVQELEFGVNAFMAAPISEIYIRSSRIKELPKGAFFAITGLRKFELTDISVNHVQSEAISISSNQIVISHSELYFTDEKAINLVAESVGIFHSTFEDMASNASLLASSKIIAIESNFFSEIPTGMFSLNSPPNSQISFINNTVAEFSLQSPLTELNDADFTSNWFRPNCSSVENVLQYRSSLETESDGVLDNNYWDSQCLSGKFISLSATANLTECDEKAVEDFIGSTCLDPLPTIRTRAREVSTPAPREARQFQLETTSTEKTVTQFLEQHFYSVDNEPPMSSAVREEVGFTGSLLVILVLSAVDCLFL